MAKPIKRDLMELYYTCHLKQTSKRPKSNEHLQITCLFMEGEVREEDRGDSCKQRGRQIARNFWNR